MGTWNDALMGTGAFWEPFLGPGELGIGRDVYRKRDEEEGVGNKVGHVFHCPILGGAPCSSLGAVV